jgi:hypothetical protein
MGSVNRNLAHLLSGISSGSAAGLGYLGVICSPTFGYGITGYISGSFPNPLVNNHAQNQDIGIFVHELGHNFDGIHTHEMTPAVDGCGDGQCALASQGTIMSYCQTCPGGWTNIRLVFGSRVLNEHILPYLNSAQSGSCSIARTPVAITSHPVSRVTGAGPTVSFSVTASGNGVVTYRWRRNGTPLNNTGGYSGTTTPTLTITSVDVQHGGSYDVQVGNVCGSVISNPATLTVSRACAPNCIPVTTLNFTPKAISGDGRTIIGQASGFGGVRWTATGGLQTVLPGGTAEAVSFDGSVIVGTIPGQGAVRWTVAEGVQPLSGAGTTSSATAISPSAAYMAGRVVGQNTIFVWPSGQVAQSITADNPTPRFISDDAQRIIANTDSGGLYPRRWVLNSGITAQPLPVPGAPGPLEVIGVSFDGAAAVGRGTVAGQTRALRWTGLGGAGSPDVQLLADAPLAYAAALFPNAIAADGKVYGKNIYGAPTGLAFRWSATGGIVDLNSELAHQVQLDNWTLREVLGVSADGRVLVGRGEFSGQQRFWRLELPRQCYSNCDNSVAAPILNVGDFTCFLNEFSTALTLSNTAQVTHYTNCDGSTAAPAVNIMDLLCFMNRYTQGCQ